MTREAWNTAFDLMAEGSQLWAAHLVAQGIENTPAGDDAQMAGWEALADCLNAVADSHRVPH